MTDIAISSVMPVTTAPATKTDTPEKVRDAAQQFEALLVGQILRSARQSGSGWLGGSEDSSSECATDYAEQQFAAALSQRGGLGIAELIAKGLQRNR